jgi:hypothetical protein
MIRAILNVIVAAVLASVGVSAQSTGPALEVASVRKHVGQQGGVARFTVSGSRVTIVALDMYDLILEAYSLKDYQLYGAEGWMGGGKNLSDIVNRERGADFYDISAKAEGDAALTRDQARVIVQSVLAESVPTEGPSRDQGLGGVRADGRQEWPQAEGELAGRQVRSRV